MLHRNEHPVVSQHLTHAGEFGGREIDLPEELVQLWPPRTRLRKHADGGLFSAANVAASFFPGLSFVAENASDVIKHLIGRTDRTSEVAEL